MIESKEHPAILLCVVDPDFAPIERGGAKSGVVLVARQSELPAWAAASAKGGFIEMCATCLCALSEIAFDTPTPEPALQSDVIVDMSGRRLCIATSVINLTPREIFFYTMFAIFRAEGRNGDGVLSLNELTAEDFDITLRRITRACGEEITIDECYRSKDFKFLLEMVEQMTSSSRRRDLDLLDFKEKLRVTFARIKRKISDAGLPTRYAITLHKERGEACYGLSIPAEKIGFAEKEKAVAGNVAGQSNNPLAA
jgi:hypothetical protein